MNNFQRIHKEGYKAYVRGGDFYKVNPYNKIESRGEGTDSYQIEAIPFFNGWEAARKIDLGLTGYSLFLDDFRFPDWVTWIELPKTNWKIATHYYSFIEIITLCGLPNFVTFDFDLDRHNLPINDLPYGNGADCARWLKYYCKRYDLKFPRCTIHSCNPEGFKQIEQVILN